MRGLAFDPPPGRLGATMSFDAGPMFATLLVSSVGFVAFVYGKRQRRAPQFVAGLLLLIFPYFVDGALPILAIGAVLVAAMVTALKLGY